MNRKKKYLLFLPAVILGAAIGPVSPASEINPPFRPGEKLTFNLRWGIFSAGTAELEVHPMTEIEGEAVHHFSLTVETNSFVDRIYKVRDRIDAYVSENMEGSTLYKKKQREGKHKRDIRVAFDREAGTARYSNFGEAKDPIDIEPGTFDPLSVFYAFRMTPVKADSKVAFHVTDGKKLQLGEGKIGGRETIKVPAGEFEAFLLEPDMREVGGVFEKSDDASLRIWISDDGRRIPVRLSSKVIVGRFTADLIEIEGANPPARSDPPPGPRRP